MIYNYYTKRLIDGVLLVSTFGEILANIFIEVFPFCCIEY
jgi:hypothetical protein